MSSERYGDAYPELARTLNALEEYARSLAGDRAAYERSDFNSGLVLELFIVPTDPAARKITITCEQFLHVTVGDIGGQFELSYSADDIELARGVIEATIAGRISQRFAFGRSRVTVVLNDGQRRSETGYSGCLTLIVPQPGWTRWGRSVSYPPYSTPALT